MREKTNSAWWTMLKVTLANKRRRQRMKMLASVRSGRRKARKYLDNTRFERVAKQVCSWTVVVANFFISFFTIPVMISIAAGVTMIPLYDWGIPPIGCLAEAFIVGVLFWRFVTWWVRWALAANIISTKILRYCLRLGYLLRCLGLLAFAVFITLVGFGGLHSPYAHSLILLQDILMQGATVGLYLLMVCESVVIVRLAIGLWLFCRKSHLTRNIMSSTGWER